MKQSHWLLCTAKNCDWSRKITPLSNLTQRTSCGLKTYSESKIELWNLQIKENAGKIKSVFDIRAALQAKKLGCCINNAEVERICLKNLQFRSTLEAIWFEFWMNGGLVTLEICVLWVVIFKSVQHSIRDTYSCNTVGHELWLAILFSLLWPTNWSICVWK